MLGGLGGHCICINAKDPIEIIERATGKHLGSFGRSGSFPANQVHGIGVDSKGNV